MSNSSEEKITVCSECMRACCWQGHFMCDEAYGAAGTVEVEIEKLRELDLEHENWWKR